ncbi:hypothetical protein MJT46_007832 [Ovis ammon polii x Ovis aries]|nr:hypothetical protein MJT46_007832 [Ovis ammon polii x Ovis aries]
MSQGQKDPNIAHSPGSLKAEQPHPSTVSFEDFNWKSKLNFGRSSTFGTGYLYMAISVTGIDQPWVFRVSSVPVPSGTHSHGTYLHVLVCTHDPALFLLITISVCQLQKKQTGMEEREPDMEFEDLWEKTLRDWKKEYLGEAGPRLLEKDMETTTKYGGHSTEDIPMQAITQRSFFLLKLHSINKHFEATLCMSSFDREDILDTGPNLTIINSDLKHVLWKTIDFLSAKTQEYIMNTTYTDRVLSLEIFMNVSIKPNLMAATSILDIECYEYGESGHLSYACPKSMLGEREPPKKKEKKKKKKIPEPEEEIEEVEESEDEGEDLDSLSQARAFQQAKIEEEQKKCKPSSGGPSTSDDSRRPRIKKSTYFSDEEELSD